MKKFLKGLFMATTAFVATLGLASCGHEHAYSEDWKQSPSEHWHECECGASTDVAAHTWGDWNVTKEATEAEEGSRERTCSVCKFTYKESIPKVVPEGFKVQYYLRGDMNSWGATDEFKLVIDGNTATLTEVEIKKGQGFKVADANWTPGQEFNTDNISDPDGLIEGSGNINVKTSGFYSFTVTYGDTDSCTIKWVRASSEPDPEPTTPEFYLVGSFAGENKWNFDDANRKLEISSDGNSSSIEATLAADDQFKIAATGWKPQFSFKDEYSVNGAFVAEGENFKVVTAGTYVFTVSDLNGTPTLAIAAKGGAQPGGETAHTNSFDYSLITGITVDKTVLTQDNFTGANAFITVANEKVTYRVDKNCIEIKEESLTVTFKGTGTLTIEFASTGGSNNSRFMLKDASGNILEGTTTATKITATEEPSYKDATVNVNEAGSYEVTGTTMVSITFNITAAGTYTLVSPSKVTNRGCRIGSIVMVDNYSE